ncbi:MAG: putative CRISPR-associated protein [Isosphaeraceae bacterium]
MKPAHTVISTVGTSLYNNLKNLKPDDPSPALASLAAAFAAEDRDAIVEGLLELEPADRTCGAEINSLASLIGKGYAVPDANLIFCHSDTPQGHAIGAILTDYYSHRDHPRVLAAPIPDLQDRDPRLFRTRGLRNLARVVCRSIREYDPSSCAINATGGYKAQIAIAVLMGQAIGVPVYYKHELFDEIIAFPPMPVALDFDAWMRLSGLLYSLERDPQPADVLDEYADDAETLESLVDRTPIDGVDFVELSPTGQIFHETFRQRFRARGEQLLPPAVPASEKKAPHFEDAGTMRKIRGLEKFVQALTDEVPQVARCATWYSNPDLPKPTRFWLGSDGIVGQYSDGKATAKFRVETRAADRAQMAAVVAVLSEWLEARG